jgi:tetratricopeptide (TPR) repeat protein
MKRYPETIQEAQETLRVHPKMDVAYGVMGSAYIKLGENAKAKEIFAQALAINPNYPHALNNLGALAAREGRIAEAEALFLRAKGVMGPREMSPYANLGNIYEMTGRIREALRMYETAVAIKPQYGSSWYTVARLRVLSGDPAGAYAPLARAIALDERWRARALQEEIFGSLREADPRVRILLRLE